MRRWLSRRLNDAAFRLEGWALAVECWRPTHPRRRKPSSDDQVAEWERRVQAAASKWAKATNVVTLEDWANVMQAHQQKTADNER